MDLANNPLLAAALAVAVVAFVVVRQLSPQTLRPRRLLVLPLVAGVYGLQALDRTPPEGVLATAALGVSLAVLVALGLARGASMRVWVAAEGGSMVRGTVVTLGLWFATIGVRLVFVLLGGTGLLGHSGMDAGSIALSVAATFGAQNLVVWLRAGGARGALVATTR